MTRSVLLFTLTTQLPRKAGQGRAVFRAFGGCQTGWVPQTSCFTIE